MSNWLDRLRSFAKISIFFRMVCAVILLAVQDIIFFHVVPKEFMGINNLVIVVGLFTLISLYESTEK